MKMRTFEKVCFGVMFVLAIALICEIATFGLAHSKPARKVKDISMTRLCSQVIYTVKTKEIDSFGNERMLDVDYVKFNTHR